MMLNSSVIHNRIEEVQEDYYLQREGQVHQDPYPAQLVIDFELAIAGIRANLEAYSLQAKILPLVYQAICINVKPRNILRSFDWRD
jgi:hypothetical protein